MKPNTIQARATAGPKGIETIDKVGQHQSSRNNGKSNPDYPAIIIKNGSTHDCSSQQILCFFSQAKIVIDVPYDSHVISNLISTYRNVHDPW